MAAPTYDHLPCDCEIDPAAVTGEIPDPSAYPDFFTSGWTEPTDSPTSGWSIEIKYNGQWYEFNHYLVDDFVRITTNNQESGDAEFTIYTGYKSSGRVTRVVPFIPVGMMPMRIRNYSQNKWYFVGFTRHKTVKMISRDDVDFSEKQFVTIHSTDLYFELEKKKTIVAVYENQTTFYILRDIIRKYAPYIDYTQIDPTLGRTVTRFEIAYESPAEILQRIMDLETTMTYRFDYENYALIIGEKSDSTFVAPVSITSEVLYDYFDLDFNIEHDYDYIANEIHLSFVERYSEGLVNVANASPIVVGNTGDEDWFNIEVRNAQFRVLSSNKYYSIAENVSEVGPPVVLELTLSTDYDEALATGVAYEIIGQRKIFVYRNTDSVEYMRSITGTNGIIDKIVQVDNESPLTFAQAVIIGTAYGNLFSYPLVSGSGNTTNTKFLIDTYFQAGDSFNFDLLSAKGFVGVVVIQSCTVESVGAHRVGFDGNIYPVLKFSLDFTQNFFSVENQIKKIMQSAQKVTLPDGEISDILQSNYEAFGERVFFSDCICPRTGLPLEEEIEVSDTITPRDLSGASGHVTSPTAGTPAYTLGPTKVSLTTV